MYEVFVSSKDFQGKRMVQQHRMVTEVCYRGGGGGVEEYDFVKLWFPASH